MTPEQEAIWQAARRYADYPTADNLAPLLDAVVALPFDQWPPNCGRITGALLTDLQCISANTHVETHA